MKSEYKRDINGNYLVLYENEEPDTSSYDECQLAQITKGQLERHKRHPSLRVGLRAFSYQEITLTRVRNSKNVH